MLIPLFGICWYCPRKLYFLLDLLKKHLNVYACSLFDSVLKPATFNWFSSLPYVLHKFDCLRWIMWKFSFHTAFGLLRQKFVFFYLALWFSLPFLSVWFYAIPSTDGELEMEEEEKLKTIYARTQEKKYIYARARGGTQGHAWESF